MNDSSETMVTTYETTHHTVSQPERSQYKLSLP
jgi:hypothetical protein